MRDWFIDSKHVRGLRKSLTAAAVVTILIAGLTWQPAYAQGNPAGFMGGVYAFADSNGNRGGDVNERFMFGQSGNNITMSGGLLPGTYTGTLIENLVYAREAAATQPGFNSIFSNRGIWSYSATCTQSDGTACTQSLFTQMLSNRFTAGSEAFGFPDHTALITLVDTNADGRYDAAQLTGDTVPNTTFNFVTSTNGATTFISIPWALAGVLGVKGNYPQVFIPLSNGRVVPDFNGDGIADPALFTSPLLAGAALAPVIPTLTEWGMIFMMLLLMVAGIMALRRSRVQITLS